MVEGVALAVDAGHKDAVDGGVFFFGCFGEQGVEGVRGGGRGGSHGEMESELISCGSMIDWIWSAKSGQRKMKQAGFDIST